MPDELLCRFKKETLVHELLTDDLRIKGSAGASLNSEDESEIVCRNFGTRGPIDLSRLAGLMKEFNARFPLGDLPQKDRASSDRWLAPRLHYAIRLTRREAADVSIWRWLAVRRFADYVVGRFPTRNDDVTAPTNRDRFDGGINKQALARLWWGAELFRNGADYSAVDDVFAMQDIPNSFLHHKAFENRPLALAAVGLLASIKEDDDERMSSKVQAFGRVLNLSLAGASLDAEISPYDADSLAYLEWVQSSVGEWKDFVLASAGPPDGVVPAGAAAEATRLVSEAASLAHIVGDT